MKQLTFTTLVAIVLLFTTCKKDGPSNILPEATQEGKNTMGMKVNGEVWTPYAPCGFGQNPCGAIGLDFHTPYTKAYSFNAHYSRKSNGVLTSLIFTSLLNSTISTVGNKYDSVNISYNDYHNGINTYNKSSDSKGRFIITKLDFAKEIISGTFECTLYKGMDSIVITEGRFDCKFSTCICN